jgi:hypothetical protein
LVIIVGGDGSPLHAAKEVIHHVDAALVAGGVSGSGGSVANVVTTRAGAVRALRCGHEEIVARGLGSAGIEVGWPSLGESGSISSQVTMLLVIVSIGRSCGKVSFWVGHKAASGHVPRGCGARYEFAPWSFRPWPRTESSA